MGIAVTRLTTGNGARRARVLPAARLTWPLAAFAVIVVALAVLLAAHEPVFSARAASSARDYARTAVTATNGERAKRDVHTLAGHWCLQHYANRQAAAMASEERLYHQDLQPVLQECGLSWAGENVARGFPDGASAVQGWMASPSHRRNILARKFTHVAVAAQQSDDGVWYAAQVFGLPA